MVRVTQSRGITQGNGNASVISLYLRPGKESICHLRKHTRDALTLVARQSKGHQCPDDTRIATVVNTFQSEQLFQC